MRTFLILLCLIPQLLVAQNAPPQAHFIAANNAICGSTYNEAFADQSSNNPTSWKWYFPGATPDTSTLKNPTNIIYTGYGCYTVKLVVKNQYGSDSVTDTNTICLDSMPHITFTGDLRICSAEPKLDTLIVHGGTSYYWINGDTTPYFTFYPRPLVYINVTVYNGACSKDTFFYLISDSMPVFAFRGDTSICLGTSTTITAFSPTNYLYKYYWSTGSTSDTIVVKGTKEGVYTYSLTVTKGGCIDSSQIKIGVHDCTGIENYYNPAASIQVYPNPSNGVFALSCHSERSEESNPMIEVYNVLGEKVYSQFIVHSSSFIVNLSGQPNGVYLYRVISENGNLVGEGKLVIQR